MAAIGVDLVYRRLLWLRLLWLLWLDNCCSPHKAPSGKSHQKKQCTNLQIAVLLCFKNFFLIRWIQSVQVRKRWPTVVAVMSRGNAWGQSRKICGAFALFQSRTQLLLHHRYYHYHRHHCQCLGEGGGGQEVFGKHACSPSKSQVDRLPCCPWKKSLLSLSTTERMNGPSFKLFSDIIS